MTIEPTSSRALVALPFWPSSPSGPILDEEIRLIKNYLPFLRLISDSKAQMPSVTSQLPYLAAPDEIQLRHFLGLLHKDQDSILWAVRGGYGSMRWCPKLLECEIPPKAPMVLGFSDVTHLILAMHKLGQPSIHGPLIKTLPKTSVHSLTALAAALRTREFPVLQGKSLRGGVSTGTLIAGNLSCIAASIGTPIEPRWDEVILAVEDHKEPPYRIDRYFTHLLSAGILHRIRGLAIGAMIPSKSSDKGTIKTVIEDIGAKLRCPVVYGLPFGHGGENMPLLVGKSYLLDGGRGILAPCSPSPSM